MAYKFTWNAGGKPFKNAYFFYVGKPFKFQPSLSALLSPCIMKCSEIRCTPYPHLLHFCSILHFCRSLAWARQTFHCDFSCMLICRERSKRGVNGCVKCSRNRAKLKSACLSRFFLKRYSACYRMEKHCPAFPKIIFLFSDFTYKLLRPTLHTM